MKFLGLDYGSKRIGVALSDEGGTLAFPKTILQNTESCIEEIKEIVVGEDVKEIVLGESLSADGEPNPINDKANIFAENLKDILGLPVHREKEFFTTVEARRYSGEESKVDGAAAALILQRYLDRVNKSK